jgi:6-pyruvoyl-tetrahydropterin synthase
VFFCATHVPVHPSALSRWKLNLHGHTHANNVTIPTKVKDDLVIDLPDKRYLCVCMEQLDDYKPMHMDEIVSIIRARGLDSGGSH